MKITGLCKNCEHREVCHMKDKLFYSENYPPYGMKIEYTAHVNECPNYLAPHTCTCGDVWEKIMEDAEMFLKEHIEDGAVLVLKKDHIKLVDSVGNEEIDTFFYVLKGKGEGNAPLAASVILVLPAEYQKKLEIGGDK